MSASAASRVVHLELADCPCPAGGITIAVHDGRVCGLGFSDRWAGLEAWIERRFGGIRTSRAKDPAKTVTRLRAYLHGELTAIDEIEVDLGGTPFQQTVWQALRRIPAGRTISYGELARWVNAPTASRAVGAANGANPVSIIVPCHRVIGSNGQLTGYGGGMPRKRWLLRHEGALPGLPLED